MLCSVLRAPDRLLAVTEQGTLPLERQGETWRTADLRVRCLPQGTEALAIAVEAPTSALLRLQLRWRVDVPAHLLFLGDAWERTYGDAAWRTMVPERPLPWYLLAHDGAVTDGLGVATGAGTLACWQLDERGVSLWLDCANGGRGVRLGERTLAACTIVGRAGIPGESAFEAAHAFARRLCPAPRLPAGPIIGGNDWYYAYGHSSGASILRDAALLAELCPAGDLRPFQIVDGGWARHDVGGCEGGPWQPNARFPALPRLAEDIRARGCRPGIWVRPLRWEEPLPQACLLRPERCGPGVGWYLDPTHPEGLARARASVADLRAAGFDLLKHDFTTFDLLGRWGFQMGFSVTTAGWGFADASRTTAEVIRELYDVLWQAADGAELIACNTIGHLAAGRCTLQRIGDDTSGRAWERTRRMGVNTLAFRAHQHLAFFAADADCVPVTTAIDPARTRAWLDLVARSGTPLFVSLDPAALEPRTRADLQAAFRRAAQPQPTIQPLDWLRTTCPLHWRAGDDALHFDWYGDEGLRAYDVV